MRIYRIEDTTGYGPWKSGHLKYLQGKHKVNFLDDDHPSLYQEWCLHSYKDEAFWHYFCGCRSIKQLLHWFPRSMLKEFDLIGSSLTIWESPKKETVVGDYQVLFRKDKASLIYKGSPSVLKNIAWVQE